MAVSNNLTAILNFLALICSFPIIAAGIWIASNPTNHCIHWIRWPLVFLGASLLIISLTGFVGSYWKKEGLLAVYLVSMFILIILLLILLILAFVVTRPNGAYAVPGTGFHEYRIDGFSSWLRNHITANEYWGKIRVCLAEQARVCAKLDRKFVAEPDFLSADLSPIESGCCKPPMACGFKYSTPTTWISQSNVGTNSDCTIWNNNPNELCYNCNSCKAGLLGNLRAEWRKANVVLIVAVVVLIWVYLVACCAYKNAQTESLFNRYKRGWV